MDGRTAEELRDLGAGRAAPADVAALYRRAFAEFGTLCLWSVRALAAPTIRQALNVADALRREGNAASRTLAAQIEAACRAAV